MTHHCPTCSQPLPPAHGITVDPVSRRITYSGKTTRVPTGEFRIFELLLKRIGRAVPYEALVGALFFDRLECDMPRCVEVLVRSRVCTLRRNLALLDLRIPLDSRRWHAGYTLEFPESIDASPRAQGRMAATSIERSSLGAEAANPYHPASPWAETWMSS